MSEEESHKPREEAEISDDQLDRMEAGVPNANADEAQQSMHVTEQPPGGDRLSRMEALMESLLVVSSEQALAREQQAARMAAETPEEIARLRQEISQLRVDLQQQAVCAQVDLMTTR